VTGRALAAVLLLLPLPVATEAAREAGTGPPGATSDGRYRMGTVLEVTLHGGEPGLLEALFQRVAELEALLSRHDPASEISRLNAAAGAGPRTVDPRVARLLDACIAYSKLMGGAFDVTVGPLVALWTQAGRSGRRPDAADLTRARARVGADKLRVDREGRAVELLLPGMSVDLGGVAKGAALDALVEMLAEAGVEAALLSFGQSSLHAVGAPPGESGWRVLLRDASGGFAGVATLRDRALSVSASLGQSVEIDGVRYGHVLDPRSGEPLRARRMAAVIAGSGELAEALSKALLVLEPEEGVAALERVRGAEGLLLDREGGRWSTSGFVEATRFEPLAPRRATGAAPAQEPE
jgi:thiamine biosynthesis lipoprotein